MPTNEHITVHCPTCGAPSVYAQDGEPQEGYTVPGGVLWPWTRLQGCEHSAIEGGMMTPEMVAGLPGWARAWRTA